MMVALTVATVQVSSIPLEQFLPFGESAGDDRLSPGLDVSSPPITLSPPFVILGRERNPLHVSQFYLTLHNSKSLSGHR